MTTDHPIVAPHVALASGPFLAVCKRCQRTLAEIDPERGIVTLSIGPKARWSLAKDVAEVSCNGCGAIGRIAVTEEMRRGV